MTSRRDPVQAVRRAVEDCLADLPGDACVLVGVSGGADSLALAQAVALTGRPAAAGIIDHALQPDSADVAARAARACERLGLDSVIIERVDASAKGVGPEAAARDARRAALEGIADRLGAAAILLAHTRDDQAETVLLRLARGSGARSLAAMAPVTGRWRRPLLDLPRDVVRASAEGLDTWEDPHNDDPGFARTRVRHGALPALVDALGPDVVSGLARSARLLSDDADALDDFAGQASADVTDADGTLDAVGLAALPRALRTRIIRSAAIASGCPAGALTAAHVDRIESLVTDWHGQGGVDLPGGLIGERAYGRLAIRRVPPVAERRRHDREE
ncbi:MAG: tRNA lysidine(34) synthetase TilS [Actinomycetota bacterium]